MSEKRFFINGIMVIDGENIISSTMWQSEEQQKKYCDELNKLHEENEQLKKLNAHLKNELSWIRDYAYWKEKDAFNKLFGAYMETCEEYRILVKANEQLKEQLSEQGTRIDFLKDENKHMGDLVNENKQLKYEIEKVCESNEDLLEEKRRWKELSDNYAKLYEENENLKAQLCCDESVCSICQYQYLVETERYYIAKCEKGHEECSKEDIKYCEEFKELKE